MGPRSMWTVKLGTAHLSRNVEPSNADDGNQLLCTRPEKRLRGSGCHCSRSDGGQM